MRNYSIISITNEWDMYRRRYRSLMSEMIKYKDINNILFIESPLTLFSLVRYLLKKMNKRDRKRWQRLFKQGVIYKAEDVDGDIYIVTPVVPFPFYSQKILLRINIIFLHFFQKLAVAYLSRKTNIKDVIFWVCNPNYYTGLIIDEDRINTFCYDLCDNYLQKFSDKTTLYAEWLRKNDEYLTKKADIIFVSSEKLYEDREIFNRNIHRIPNAVDWCYFQSCVSNSDVPVEFSKLERPILIYVGNIDRRLDENIMDLLLNGNSKWTIVMVGSRKKDAVFPKMSGNKKICFLGERSFEKSSILIKHSDVCIIPHKVTELTKSMNILKLYSFIAAGKPIVTTSVGGVNDFKEVVKISYNANEFICNIKHVLSSAFDRELQQEKCMNIAQNNTWVERAKEAHNLLTGELCERN